MSNLSQILEEKVSPAYRAVAREVLAVLDPKLEYEAIHTSSPTILKREIGNLTSDIRGFLNIHNTVAVLTGQITAYPRLIIETDFIIILVKNIIMNPHNKEVKRGNYLLIYENTNKSGGRVS